MSNKTPCGKREPAIARALEELDRITARVASDQLEVTVGCTKVLAVGPGRLVVASVVGSFDEQVNAEEFRDELEGKGWSCRKLERSSSSSPPARSGQTVMRATPDRDAQQAISDVAQWLSDHPSQPPRDTLDCTKTTDGKTSQIYVAAPGKDLSSRRDTLELLGWDCLLWDDKGKPKA